MKPETNTYRIVVSGFEASGQRRGMKYIKSVSTKVMLIFVLLIFPLNFLAIFQANSMISNTVQQVKYAEQNMVDVYASMLDGRMENTASLLHYFRTEDSDCLALPVQTDVKAYEYVSARQKLYYKLKKMAGMVDGADGYFYYMPKVDDLLVCSSVYAGKEKNQNLKEAVADPDFGNVAGGWYICQNEESKYAILVVRLKNISYGAWINIDRIADTILKGMEYENVSFTFSDGNDTQAKKKDLISVSAKAKSLSLTLSLDREEIIRTNAVYQRVMLFAVFFYLILTPILYVFMRRLLINPLNRINEAHRQLQKGNQDFRLEEKSNSREFLEAYRSFNQMAENLKTLRIQAYENRIEKQQMELRNLQLQIRPHFLLNTFNLIYSLAEKRESEPIQNVTIFLSEYFRYIFRSDRQLELFSKELRLIKGYIYMASMRYENQVELSVDLDPEIDFVRTPPLLIHNFVENAVKYGYRQGKCLNVDIQGRYNDGWVTFQITDNGNGMEPEMLERNRKIFRGELVPQDKTAHLGLYNSYKRLKYFYGEGAHLEVLSQPGEMTCFTLCFPYNLEVDDESFDGE